MDSEGVDQAVARFLGFVCVDYGDPGPTPFDPARATRELAEPGVRSDPAVAAVLGDAVTLSAALQQDPEFARGAFAPQGWTALTYLAYARPEQDGDVVTTARLLLEAGADPDAPWFEARTPTPFTPLTGAFGCGEQDQPPHRHSVALVRTLLGAGATAHDEQLLYHLMFRVDPDAVTVLDLLFAHGLSADVPAVRRLLAWAVLHDQRDRITQLARHGVDLGAPLDGHLVGPARTPLELALVTGRTAVATRLLALGVPPTDLDAADGFTAAVLAGDAEAVAVTPPHVVQEVRASRPGLLVWAVGIGSRPAVDLLLAAGFSPNALARSDVPVEQPWQTALHTAVERRDRDLVVHLLAHGADRTVRDARFDGTPQDWALHLGHPDLAALCAPA